MTNAAPPGPRAFLAQHQQHKQPIIDYPQDGDYIWNAAEELIHYNGFHHMSREVTRDAEFAGVQLKAGDTIVLPTASANRDARKFEDPLTVDFERKNARQHLTFGAGVHRCVWSHLATAQLRIALEEVHAFIPDYAFAGPVEYMSGWPKVSPVLRADAVHADPLSAFKRPAGCSAARRCGRGRGP